MRMSYLAACILATSTAIGAAPLAFSVPGVGTQVMPVTKYRSTSDYAYGNYYGDDNSVDNGFWVQSWDDMDGVAQGTVLVWRYSDNTLLYSEVGCSGPEYAGAVSVDPTNGSTTLNVTLDPRDPNCYSRNVVEPVVVNLSGQADGNYHGTQAGVGTGRYTDATFRYFFKVAEYSGVFTGSNGFYDGTFSGSAGASRTNNWQRVK